MGISPESLLLSVAGTWDKSEHIWFFTTQIQFGIESTLPSRNRVNCAIPWSSGISPFSLLALNSRDFSDTNWDSRVGIEENLLEAATDDGKG